MKSMGRVYDHVIPEMERQIREALEERFITSVLALENDERQKLLSWVPVIKDTVEEAQQEAADLAANLVEAHRDSHVAPMEGCNENRSGGESAS